MRLVIISSDPDGKVGLVSERVFADAAEATRELARMFSEGAADASASFYTVDMDSAVPVIVLQPAPSPAAPVEKAEEPALEEPAEDLPEFEAAAEEPAEAEEPPAEPVAEEATAAVEAASDDAEPAEAEEPQEEPAEEAEEPLAGSADEAEELPEPEAAEAEEPLVASAADEAEPADAAEPAESAQQWPWDLPIVVPEGAVDEDVAATDSGSDSEATPEPEAEAEEEPSAEEIVVGAGMDELLAEVGLEDVTTTAFEPMSAAAVEAGADMPDEAEVEGEGPVAVEFTPEDLLGIGELGDLAAAVEVVAPEQEAAADEVVEPQSVLDVTAGEESVAPVEEAPASDRVYEPGALNMNEYTCDDCVYVNTCPNQHQKKPAECGSFQWRSM